MKRVLLAHTFILSLLILASCNGKNGTDQFTLSPDGVEICYSSYGKGKDLIVFVHGWCCDKSYWDSQVMEFSKNFQVVTIDLGGHGKSGVEREDWTMQAFGDDVNAVLEKFAFDRVYLVGHSMGADVVIEAAASNNRKNMDLILVDRFRENPEPWQEDLMEKFLVPFVNDFPAIAKDWVSGPNFFVSESDPDLVERVSNDMSQEDPDIALSAFRNLFRNDIRSAIVSLRDREIKMTAINSDYKEMDTTIMKELGINTIIMSEVGHFVMMEKPEEFNKILHQLTD